MIASQVSIFPWGGGSFVSGQRSVSKSAAGRQRLPDGKLCCTCVTSLQAAAAAPAAPAVPRSLSEAGPYPADFVRRRLLTFAGIVVG
jgi:hypothetical protein